jgi:hypothetical protein
MVRRWSYLNSVNTYYSTPFEVNKQAAFGVTVRATMYFRGDYTIPSLLTRSRWGRRKHLYGWLQMSNILKSWAQIYRFNRNHLKFIFRQHATASSFLAFNALSVKNTIPYLNRGSESIVLSNVTRKVLKFFSRYSNTINKFLLMLKNVNLSLVSLPTEEIDYTQYLDNSFAPVFLRDELTRFSTPSVKISTSQDLVLKTWSQLLSISFSSYSVLLKHIYRLLTLLTLKHVSL